MFIPIKSIWLAVHRVFSDAGIHPGDSLPVQKLMQVWPESGLRQRDLATALESLSRVGFVRLTMTPQGVCAELVDEQFGLLDRNGRDNAAAATLNRIRQARGMPAHLAPLRQEYKEGRRSEDRAETLARAA